jgi:hypothetical protein
MGGTELVINSNSTIKVVCRFRPEKEGEALATTASGVLTPGQSGILLDNERGTVEMLMDTYDRKAFTFDKLFSMRAGQQDVFSSLEDIVDGVMGGFNGTVSSSLPLFLSSSLLLFLLSLLPVSPTPSPSPLSPSLASPLSSLALSSPQDLGVWPDGQWKNLLDGGSEYLGYGGAGHHPAGR